MFKSLSIVVSCVAVIGCSGSKSAGDVNLQEQADQKTAAMAKLVEAMSQPNAEFAVRYALEKFRNVPFQAKALPDATKAILATYETSIRGKLRGEVAAEVDAEMNLLAEAIK